jgi:phenylacetate-CoA ligase
MNTIVLSAYHAMPAWLRSAIASVRGEYLRSWRYSKMTERLAEEALAREYWLPAEWTKWKEKRLSLVLHRAATRVPYYRDHWARRRRLGDRASWEVLGNWPILEKETVRRHGPALISDDCRRSRMFHDHTSGTTGKALDLWFNRATVREWYALFEARCRRWYGVSRFDKWAMIGGQLVIPASQQQAPFWVWNTAFRQLYFSAYHISPRNSKEYIEALRRYEVRYLLGYPSAMHALAREALSQGLIAPKLNVAIANAEPLLPQQREEISEAFHCPVRELYGMTELVSAASECEKGRMHFWPEVGEVEVSKQVGDHYDDRGEFVCTGLLNADMPLIRYRVGDRGSIPRYNANCECGRTLPVLDVVEGRSDDLLYTRDGRRIGRLDPIFKSRLPVQEAQIIQDSLEIIRVRYVPSEGFSSSDEQSVINRVRERMGAVNVILERVDSIPRTTNGKFRAVICNLSSDERKQLDVE